MFKLKVTNCGISVRTFNSKTKEISWTNLMTQDSKELFLLSHLPTPNWLFLMIFLFFTSLLLSCLFEWIQYYTSPVSFPYSCLHTIINHHHNISVGLDVGTVFKSLNQSPSWFCFEEEGSRFEEGLRWLEADPQPCTLQKKWGESRYLQK